MNELKDAPQSAKAISLFSFTFLINAAANTMVNVMARNIKTSLNEDQYSVYIGLILSPLIVLILCKHLFENDYLSYYSIFNLS